MLQGAAAPQRAILPALGYAPALWLTKPDLERLWVARGPIPACQPPSGSSLTGRPYHPAVPPRGTLSTAAVHTRITRPAGTAWEERVHLALP